MSLKDVFTNLFASNVPEIPGPSPNVMLNVVGRHRPVTDYTNALVGNRRLSRAIYENTARQYALSAHLVKPIINNNANFIGTPTLYGNKKTVKLLEDLSIPYVKIHKAIEIDGDILIWPQWDNKKKAIRLEILPTDNLDSVFVDPITNEITGYRFIEIKQYDTPSQSSLEVTIEIVITEDEVVKSYTGSTMNKVEHAPNIFGELPIVHFSNDKSPTELFGRPEIMNIEPQLKFYHELTFEAGTAQKRDGHPKLKVTTKNVKRWVDNNFGDGAYNKVVSGQGSLVMDDRDLFLNQEDDDIAYLYLAKTSGDYSTLSETTFTNIVEGSETPEINFGANLGTSLASVKEYRPVWIKKIQAKQTERTEPWLHLYDLIIKLHNFVMFDSLPNDITMTWPRPNFASIQEQSEIVKGFATAIQTLKDEGVLSKEEIYDTLKELDIFDLIETYKKHQKAIDEEAEEDAKKALEQAAAQNAIQNPDDEGDGDSGDNTGDDSGDEE